MSKFDAAWAWVKKNWHWIVVPVGVVLYLLGRAGRRNVTVVSPALVEHEQVAQKAETAAQVKMKLAVAERARKLEGLNQNHDQVVQRIQEADARTAEALKDDPIALNRFLNQVDKTTKS